MKNVSDGVFIVGLLNILSRVLMKNCIFDDEVLNTETAYEVQKTSKCFVSTPI